MSPINFRISIVLLLAILASCQEKASNISGEWEQLFNGHDISDWNVKINGYPFNENFGNTFRVEDGVIKVSYDAYQMFDERFGHLFYKDKFSAYLLGVEYRFIGEQSPGGPDWAFRNSGIMLHCQEPSTMGINQDFPISIEAQLLGGGGTGERPTLNLCTPGTHVEMNGALITIHCVTSDSKTYHGDQWVRAEVLVLRDSLIMHIIDGDTVLAYQKPQIGGGNVSNYDPKIKQDGNLLTEGYISLQSESHPLEFRKVELFDLSPYYNEPEKLKDVLNILRKR